MDRVTPLWKAELAAGPRIATDDSGGVAGETARLAALSFASPALGFLLDLVLAWKYGNGSAIDAYRVASTVFATGFSIFFLQVLPHVMMPLFSQCRALRGDAEAWRMALSFNSLAACAGAALVVCVWLNPGPVTTLLAPGFQEQSRREAMVFVKYLCVALTLVLWSGTLSAPLSAYGLFWPSAVAPLLLNATTMIGAFLGSRGSLARILASSVLAGAILVAGLHLYYAVRISSFFRIRARDWLRPGLSHEMPGSWRLALPALCVALTTLVVSVLILRSLSLMKSGTVALYSYAFRLTTLVHTPAACYVTVVFPALSQARTLPDEREFRRIAAKAVRVVLFLTVGTATLLYAIRGALVELLFGWGSFEPAALLEMSTLFGLLLLGAATGSLTSLFQKCFAALQRNVWNVASSAISLLLVIAALPYCAGVGSGGVAAVFVISCWLNTVLLGLCLMIRHRICKGSAMLRYAAKVFAVALTMGLVGVSLPFPGAGVTGDHKVALAAWTLLLVLMMAAAATAMSRLMQLREAREAGAHLGRLFQRVNPWSPHDPEDER